MDKTSSPNPPTPPAIEGLGADVYREMLSTIHDLQRDIEQKRNLIDLLLKRLYGPRADKINPLQRMLFDGQPPAEQQVVPEPQEPEITPSKRSGKGHGRKAIPDDLRREVVSIDVTAAEKAIVGGVWTRIGEEISERLDYTPSQLFVRRIIRPKYVVRFQNMPDQMRVADLPPEAMPKSKAAPGLVADIIVSKLVDHLPLYRQEKRHARQGVKLSRSTLCGWLRDAATALEPLYIQLKQRILAANFVHTDDTPVPVQDDAREHCRTGRLWAYVSGGGTVYDATPDRCRVGPISFLQEYQGYLQCDAYPGYNGLFARGNVVEVGCWAHARRKFVDAAKTSAGIAHEAVARIKGLYAVEHEARDIDVSQRALLRQEKSVPLLEAMKSWLEKQRDDVLPKSPMGEAITYTVNQWSALNVYTRDGNLAIDNNRAERAVKPFAIGRKNWLFFGSDRGGRTLAILASFTATCEQFGINPWTYLRDTLTHLPQITLDRADTLLPTK